jgi:hypothetical protein
MRQLAYQAKLLVWFYQRGDLASRTALIVAFLGASPALALDQKRKASAAKISAKQTTIAATPVAEPNKEKEVEPQHEPAQIETAEQAATLKAAPKKEHAEA